MVRNILFIGLFFGGLPISMLLAQSPALTALEPVVTNTYMYKETPSSPITYQAKVVFFGMVNPNGGTDTVYFEYGLTTSYGGTMKAQPALVGGNSLIQVNATAILNNYGQSYYCRMKVISSAGTYYGDDLYFFVPFIDDPTEMLYLHPPCSDGSQASLQILNNNPFSVSITCSDGTNRITQIIPSNDSYFFACNRNTLDSIYINYTNPSGTITYPVFFRTIPSNDQLCTDLPQSTNYFVITPNGYNISKDSTFCTIENGNRFDAEIIIIVNENQLIYTAPAQSTRFITLSGYGDYSFYYSNVDLGDFSAPLFLNRTLNGSLPVELSTFLSNVNGRNIQLSWETKTEKNSNKFEIQRSFAMANQWASIGSVKAADLSNSPKEYSFTDNKLQSGKYQYRLKMIDNDGTFEYSKIVEAGVSLPKNFDLSQNFPNPFNPSTKIDYQIPLDAKVVLDIYNTVGQKVVELVNQTQSAGYYTINFGASNISSGIYVYRLSAVNQSTGKNFSMIKKMMLLK